MSNNLIYGIQQIGVGVSNAEDAFNWYASRFGYDIQVFEDCNTATLMAPYMGGRPHEKKAILAMNMRGGGGLEIWQYQDRTPKAQNPDFQLGDLGVNLIQIKSSSVSASYLRLKAIGEQTLLPPTASPDGIPGFSLQDPAGNFLFVKEHNSWFSNRGMDTGGTFGCTIGVSNIEESLLLYRDVLGYDTTVYDVSGNFADLAELPGGEKKFRRVLLANNNRVHGGFSELLGDSQLELIQSLDRVPAKIFENRYWGDLGFIHLCFDIRSLGEMQKLCLQHGFRFVVKSAESFDMGDANGCWGYIEDPDGTLIEFVETRSVPISKKLGLKIDLASRDRGKPLPRWLVNGLRFRRVKTI